MTRQAGELWSCKIENAEYSRERERERRERGRGREDIRCQGEARHMPPASRVGAHTMWWVRESEDERGNRSPGTKESSLSE